MTLLEVLLAALIVSILTAAAIPKVYWAIERAKVARAISDISALSSALNQYQIDKPALPASSLTDLVPNYMDHIPKDPWGEDYQYYNHQTASGSGFKRMDGPIVPINSRFDLYSKGKNKLSTPNIQGAPSKDDVIMASDGGFIGLAKEY